MRRKAVPSDFVFMLALRKMTMSEHLANSGMCMSDESHFDRVMVEYDSAEVLELSGIPVGIVKVKRAGGKWELIQIQLLPELQGMGIGSRLIKALLAEAEHANASVGLSVLKTNPARRLYTRLGFAAIGEDESSLLMLWGAGSQAASFG